MRIVSDHCSGDLPDLVFSAYAHASIPQLELYRRLAGWVRPGGRLVVIAHQHDAHDHQHPVEATVTAPALNRLLDPAQWDHIDVRSSQRTVVLPGGSVPLQDLLFTANRTA